MTRPSLVRCYSLFFTALIVMAIICPAWSEEIPKSRKKRAIPIAYVGMAVAPQVFRWLVRAYGAAAVTAAGVTLRRVINRSRSNDNHSCYGNRGWCRSSCRSYEREYRGGNLGVCGSYKCCVT
uniref:Big defensin n=1 Tax=Argopecten irradians TaxID=31199 RepID=BDEF_ARGIR|nr:RecName: Full=Big defensin; Short=AiBD; Flags: Precursor [Argopecten irradians]ABC61319.1 big defensin [Argopecten irradians]